MTCTRTFIAATRNNPNENRYYEYHKLQYVHEILSEQQKFLNYWIYLKNIRLRKKSRHKRVHTVRFHLYEVLEQAKLFQKSEQQLLLGAQRQGVYWKDEGTVQGDKDSLHFDWGAITWVYNFSKLIELYNLCIHYI